MGTSASNKGPNSKSPLVPPWADCSPEKPLPEPKENRFRNFRIEFGRVVGKASGASWDKAIKLYAAEATGGCLAGPRRFGPEYSAGARLVLLLSELAGGGTGEDATGCVLITLKDQTRDYAAQQIAQALAPSNADADLVRVAVQEALLAAIPPEAAFDPAALSTSEILDILIAFFSRALFQEVTAVAGDAWNKSKDPERTLTCEKELEDRVRKAIDKHVRGEFSGGIANLSRAELEAAMQRAIESVWLEWEEGG